MRKWLVLFVVVNVLGMAATALADPNVPNIRAHRHFVATPSGKLVQVGPRLCDDASLQHAFNQFHVNVHHSATSPTTPVETLGPQHGAPGLHNGEGAEIVARGC